ncbi:TolC family protein [Variovorax sp. GT1P44]|uniref:TolC family protein n=1 Tax=Variovorax sp. GT1P44 TaxID=3443742 RepID=UPI003F454667
MRRFFWPLGLAATLFSPFVSQAQPALPPSALGQSPAAADASSGSLTLDQALAFAVAKSPLLAASERELEATQGAVQQAGALRNPELSALLEDTNKETRTTTGVVSFPIELGGKRAARVAAAERGQDVARAELSNAKAQLKSTVIAAFFAVMVAQERVRLASGSAEIALQGADVTARRVAAGKISPVDETRAQVEMANAQLELSEAKAELFNARQTLAAQWGAAAPHFTEARGDLDNLPARASAESLQGELLQSPSLRTSRMELDRRRALVDVENSKRYSDVTLSVGAKRDNELGRTQAVVGVSVPLPFFDRNQGNVYEATKRVEKAEEEYQYAQIRLANELSSASKQLEVSRASAQTLKTTVLPAAQRAHDAATKGFEAGKFGFLDVLDAQRSLLQARVRYLGALASSYQAATTIDRILGH